MTIETSSGCENGPTRRTVLGGAALTAAALSAPGLLRAAGHGGVVRYSMTSPEGLEQMATYRKAVGVMLSLDPSDPHNWHRYALIHLMDCPHMNWWFFVWHRPYTGYFERIIRLYGEDESFALPFWDWSAGPVKKVPETMFITAEDPDNPLDPRSSAYPEWDTFQDGYYDVMAAEWAGLDDGQLLQLDARGYPTFHSFWEGDETTGLGVKPNFTNDRSRARSKTAETPELTDRGLSAVQYSAYKAGLTTHNFLTERQVVNGLPATVGGLNTAQTLTHHQGSSFGSLVEGQPHNLVHNNLGFASATNMGWMPSLLSPVDPVFFMHHCNVDRLWDIWTRRQELNGRPHLPAAGLQSDIFNKEAFLFYIDEAKQNRQTTAGASMNIDPDWGYSYGEGTGSELVRPDADQGATMAAAHVSGLGEGGGEMAAMSRGPVSLAVPGALAEAVAAPEARQVAHLNITPMGSLRGVSFDVFVSPKGTAPEGTLDSDGFAGSMQFFGMSHGHGEMGFSIDITDALDRLQAAGALEPEAEFDLTVVTDGGEGVQLNSVSVETIFTG